MENWLRLTRCTWRIKTLVMMVIHRFLVDFFLHFLCLTHGSYKLYKLQLYHRAYSKNFQRRSLFAVARPPLCRLSVVCNVRAPYSGGSIFRNISTALGTLAIHLHPLKISRISSQGNPSAAGVKHKRGSQVQRFRTYRRHTSRKRCKIGGKLVLISNRKSYMSFRLVPKSVTLNDLKRRNGVILRYFSEFGQLPGALRKSSRSLSHLLMSSCNSLAISNLSRTLFEIFVGIGKFFQELQEKQNKIEVFS